MPKHSASEKTKSEILKTAERLFNEKGWDNVNISDIVTEIGVTRGAFYHYFNSREDLIYSVIMQSFIDNNPFLLASKEKELNAIQKLRFALKINLNLQFDVASTSDMSKTMYDPIVFKSNVFFSINIVAPYIEKLLVEGNADGSISVEYPKHTAHAVCLIFNEWLNPTIFQMSEQEFSDRLLFLNHLGERLGVPIIDDELEKMVWRVYECCSKS